MAERLAKVAVEIQWYTSGRAKVLQELRSFSKIQQGNLSVLEKKNKQINKIKQAGFYKEMKNFRVGDGFLTTTNRKLKQQNIIAKEGIKQQTRFLKLRKGLGAAGRSIGQGMLGSSIMSGIGAGALGFGLTGAAVIGGGMLLARPGWREFTNKKDMMVGTIQGSAEAATRHKESAMRYRAVTGVPEPKDKKRKDWTKQELQNEKWSNRLLELTVGQRGGMGTGLGVVDSNELLGGLMEKLKGFGLKGKTLYNFAWEMIGDATDLSSFHNISMLDAADDLIKVLSGEMEKAKNQLGWVHYKAEQQASVAQSPRLQKRLSAVFGREITKFSDLNPEEKAQAISFIRYSSASEKFMGDKSAARGDYYATYQNAENVKRTIISREKDLQMEIGQKVLKPVEKGYQEQLKTLLTATGKVKGAKQGSEFVQDLTSISMTPITNKTRFYGNFMELASVTAKILKVDAVLAAGGSKAIEGGINIGGKAIEGASKGWDSYTRAVDWALAPIVDPLQNGLQDGIRWSWRSLIKPLIDNTSGNKGKEVLQEKPPTNNDRKKIDAQNRQAANNKVNSGSHK